MYYEHNPPHWHDLHKQKRKTPALRCVLLQIAVPPSAVHGVVAFGECFWWGPRLLSEAKKVAKHDSNQYV